MYAARLSPGATVRHDLAAGRGAYVHVATGAVDAHGHALTAGDALKSEAEPHVALTATTAATVLLFDLAAVQ